MRRRHNNWTNIALEESRLVVPLALGILTSRHNDFNDHNDHDDHQYNENHD